MEEKILCVNGDTCYKYQVVSKCVGRSDEARLYSNYVKADSRIFFHAVYLAENYSSTYEVNVVAQPANTVSLIIAIGCLQNLITGKI